MQFSGEGEGGGDGGGGIVGVDDDAGGGGKGWVSCWEVVVECCEVGGEEGDEPGFVIVTRSSRYMDKARPMTSNPGPETEVRMSHPSSRSGRISMYRYWLRSMVPLRMVSNGDKRSDTVGQQTDQVRLLLRHIAVNVRPLLFE